MYVTGIMFGTEEFAGGGSMSLSFLSSSWHENYVYITRESFVICALDCIYVGFTVKYVYIDV